MTHCFSKAKNCYIIQIDYKREMQNSIAFFKQQQLTIKMYKIEQRTDYNTQIISKFYSQKLLLLRCNLCAMHVIANVKYGVIGYVRFLMKFTLNKCILLEIIIFDVLNIFNIKSHALKRIFY